MEFAESVAAWHRVIASLSRWMNKDLIKELGLTIENMTGESIFVP
jgi:hypothetical protein